MPSTVKSLGCIKCYSWGGTGPVKSPSNSINTTARISAVDKEELKPYWKSEKKIPFLLVANKPIIYKFFKKSTNDRKKTNRASLVSYRPFPIIFKYLHFQ